MTEQDNTLRAALAAAALLVVLGGLVGAAVGGLDAPAGPPRFDDALAPEGPGVAQYEFDSRIAALGWGEHLAVALEDGPVLILDAQTGDTLAEIDREATAVAWSSGGGLLATGGERPAIWTAEGDLVHALDARDEPVTSLAWSADRLALGAFSGGEIEVVDLISGEVQQRYPSDFGLTALGWVEGGQALTAVVGLQTGEVRTYAITDQSSAPQEVLPLPAYSFAAALSPDGIFMVTTTARVVQGVAAPSGVQLAHPFAPESGSDLPTCFEGPVGPLLWSDDGQRIALGDAAAGLFDREGEARVAIYDTESEGCFSITAGRADVLAFGGPQGDFIAVGGETTLTVFEVRPEERIA